MSGSLHLNHLQAERINTIDFSDTTICLTEKESGSVIFLDPANSSSNITINLPMISSSSGNTSTNKTYNGINYTFILKTNGTRDITITSKDSSNDNAALIYGEGTAAKTHTSAITTITLSNGSQQKGDRVSLICDGYNWFVTWVLQSAGTISFA